MPPKPRTVPRRRLPSQASETRRKRLIVYALAAAAIVALVIVLGAFALSGGSGGSDAAKVARAMEAAGCQLTSAKAQRNVPDHSDVRSPDARPKWNTFPPTSGPHYGIPAVYGAYTEPLQLARIVHNLEHGAVYILYGPGVPTSTVEQLRSFYREHENGTLLAPLPGLAKQIALGAWVVEDPQNLNDRGRGYLAKCRRYDAKAFSAFFDEFQFKGPERFPPSAMPPGST